MKGNQTPLSLSACFAMKSLYPTHNFENRGNVPRQRTLKYSSLLSATVSFSFFCFVFLVVVLVEMPAQANTATTLQANL